jgi:hypothetical protein
VGRALRTSSIAWFGKQDGYGKWLVLAILGKLTLLSKMATIGYFSIPNIRNNSYLYPFIPNIGYKCRVGIP